MTTSQNRIQKVLNFGDVDVPRGRQFFIPNHPFQYVRGRSPDRGTTQAGTEGEAPGTALSNARRTA
jgi:hypothetical protein